MEGIGAAAGMIFFGLVDPRSNSTKYASLDLNNIAA
jgi:hypothetical protein